jgi:pimeloyl-ACP methyl ester carboxylesterase
VRASHWRGSVAWRALAGCAWVLASSCAHPGVELEPLPAEATPYRARTEDGWELAMVRYLPKKPSGGRPVLLMHGISANSRNMDLDERHSMARWFAAHGRETWTVSLRGTGLSDAPDPSSGRKGGYAFDVFWRHDVPAALAKIREVSGAQEIDYVGHSMGGLVLYAYLSQGGPHVGAACVLGSPVRLDWGNPFLPMLTRASDAIGASWTAVPTTTPGFMVDPMGLVLEGTPLEHLLYNARNTHPRTMQRLLASGPSDISAGVAKQLAMLLQGFFGSADRRLDFRKDLAKVTTPMLVVAGKGDRIGVPPAVKAGYRALGGPKEWLLLGEENGAHADYAHLDMILGERASDELWPKLLDFLDRHAS